MTLAAGSRPADGYDPRVLHLARYYTYEGAILILQRSATDAPAALPALAAAAAEGGRS